MLDICFEGQGANPKRINWPKHMPGICLGAQGANPKRDALQVYSAHMLSTCLGGLPPEPGRRGSNPADVPPQITSPQPFELQGFCIEEISSMPTVF